MWDATWEFLSFLRSPTFGIINHLLKYFSGKGEGMGEGEGRGTFNCSTVQLFNPQPFNR